ncbi:MAG: serine protease [Amycolatopsis sp.]|jgi:streptogrisin C|uniref:S1 family peptidase n=1 Tax=Amycolatopsis sp. TaxID=37632 RepID=UPI002635D93F|nr:S1 family peptidase [Amycolatopsis sp.]MCU1685523.1 serine protease [Amycolatopsis sp.]
MARRTLFRLGTAAVLVLGTLSAAGTASAQDLSPGLLSAMQQDLGLNTQQARVRLAEESTATRVAPLAEAAAGAAFGGAWFDAGRGKLVVGLTEGANAAAVHATGADTATSTVSKAKLDDVKAKIDSYSHAKAAPAGITGWHTDPRSGSVVITVRPGAKDVSAFVDRAKQAGPVTVETAAAPQTFAAGTVGGDPYYINGNTRCSIGFSVQGGFVSAGHCGTAGSSVVGWDGSQMGSFAGSTFPGNDWSFIRTGYGWWNVGVVLGWGTVSDAPVHGSNVAPVGTSVCRSGSTTHWHCGTILGQNQTVNYAQGAVYGMTQTDVCAEPGDSGGSFISGDQAQGVTSGGWGNCSSGGQTWFQPVNPILQHFGLSLVTL